MQYRFYFLECSTTYVVMVQVCRWEYSVQGISEYFTRS